MGENKSCPIRRRHYAYVLFGEGRAFLGVFPCGGSPVKEVKPRRPLPEGFDPEVKRYRCKLCGGYFWLFPKAKVTDGR